MSKFKGLYGFYIGEAEEREIADLLYKLEKLLHFTKGLSPQERQSLPKVNDRNFPKVDNALLVIEHAPEILPGYVDGAGYKASYRLLRQLLWLQVGVKKLWERVRDSRMIVGSNLLTEAGMINRVRKDAIAAETPGISAVFERLKETYGYGATGNSNASEVEEEATENPDDMTNDETEMIMIGRGPDQEGSSDTPLAQAA